jgi:hypothetical protein
MSKKIVLPYPDLLLLERQNKMIHRLNGLFNESLPLIEITNDQRFFSNFLSKLLSKNAIEVTLIKHRNRNSLENQISWPWAFGSDFNQLPASIRNNIGHYSFGNLAKKFINEAHSHLDPSLKCNKNCKTKPKPKCRLPLLITDMPELSDEDPWAKKGRKFHEYNSSLDKENNIINALLVEHFLDEVEARNGLSGPLRKYCEQYVHGKQVEAGRLIAELSRISGVSPVSLTNEINEGPKMYFF